jgi:hypothetical protein
LTTPAIEASVGGRGGWWCGWGEVTPPELRAGRAGAEQEEEGGREARDQRVTQKRWEEEVPGRSTSLTMRGGP